MLKIISIAIPLVFSSGVSAWAQTPSVDDRRAIESALRAEGFTTWGEIEMVDREWVVEEARNPESGQVCDISIDAETYELLDSDCD